MARRTFAEVISRRRAWATGTPTEPVPIDRAELERRIVCPSCSGRMEVHPYYGPGNVVIDSCGVCDLVWLDFGELKQIVDAPGRDRGRRDAPPVRPEFITNPQLARLGGRLSGSDDLYLLDALGSLFSDDS